MAEILLSVVVKTLFNSVWLCEGEIVKTTLEVVEVVVLDCNGVVALVSVVVVVVAMVGVIEVSTLTESSDSFGLSVVVFSSFAVSTSGCNSLVAVAEMKILRLLYEEVGLKVLVGRAFASFSLLTFKVGSVVVVMVLSSKGFVSSGLKVM